MLNFCGFIQVCVFTTNHHLKIKLAHFLSYQTMLTFSIFLFSENGPLSSRKNFSISNYSSVLIFH